MEKVIATIVIIVLTLGLVSYAIVGQMGGFKDTSDLVTSDQGKLTAVVKDTDTVPGNTVKNYAKNAKLLDYAVSVAHDDITSGMYNSGVNTDIELDEMLDFIEEQGLYEMTKTYGDDGAVSLVEFELVSLAS